MHPNEIQDFVECVKRIGVAKLNFSGCFHTWSNSTQGNARKWSRLDRTLVSLKWLEDFFKTTMVALPLESSDHSPIIVVWMEADRVRYSFKFCNHWALREQYTPILKSCWEQSFKGDPLFILYK